jgi:protein-S-isoprenylcysteine O-methyltransferase Ste14
MFMLRPSHRGLLNRPCALPVYVSIGIVVRSPWILIFTLPLAAAVRYGVVVREEAYLEARFGDAYRDYKARARRWL